MLRLTARWGLIAMLASVAAFFAIIMSSGPTTPGTDAATALARGVSCTEFFLDIVPPGGDGVADNGTDPDDVTAIAISRIEPSQTSPGDYDVTSALYLGVDTDADVETLVPNEPPDQNCAAARAEAAAGAEVSNHNSRSLLVNQFSLRPSPVPSPLTSGKTVLTTRSCSFSEAIGTWIRQENVTTLTTSGPTSINDTDAVLYLATDEPTDLGEAGTVPGEPNIAVDPDDCQTPGSFPYTTVGKSYGRTVRTDDTSLAKNSGLTADTDVGGARDSADGVDDDYDGDGCTDWDELDKNFDHDYAAPNSTDQRGMDPFNPNDCDSNFESNVTMALRITTFVGSPLADDGRNTIECNLAQVATGVCVGNGFYVHCLGDIDHTKGSGAITLRTMCYPDTNFLKINETVHGAATCTASSPDNRGLCGDGKSGAPPPNNWGPANGAKETACADRVDNDGDGNLNDGCHPVAFGGIDSAHLQATGTYAAGSMTFGGCFQGFGGSAFGPNVYAAGAIDTRTGAGNMDLWNVSDANLVADCINGPPAGAAPVEAVIDFTELTNQKNAAGTFQPVSNELFHRDSDRDGCTDSQELGNVQGAGGLRDPFNPWDYYDVSPPGGNGTIDLFNDIFGVAGKFGSSPAGGAPYDRAFDRGAFLTGSNSWNLTGPDGTIDLFNDVFGIAFQFGNVC